MQVNLEYWLAGNGRPGRLFQTRIYHGEVGVSVGTSVGTGISVAVSTGCAVAVSEGGINTCVLVGVYVGVTTGGKVGEGAMGAVDGTLSDCPVRRIEEVPRQLARWSSATVTP
jgi:hypothetical protein